MFAIVLVGVYSSPGEEKSIHTSASSFAVNMSSSTYESFANASGGITISLLYRFFDSMHLL